MDETWWEQLDSGVQWTDNRKFLLLVPMFLFLFVAWATHYQTGYMVVNLVGLSMCVVPKLPWMDGVRLGGLNRKHVD